MRVRHDVVKPSWILATFILTLTTAVCQVRAESELYIVQYGKLATYRYMVGTRTAEVKEMPLQIGVLKRGDKHVLFGTGFSDPGQLPKEVRVHEFRPARDLLLKIGVSPDSVGAVVLPSLGYGSIGDMKAYSRARVFIQEADVGAVNRYDIGSQAMEQLVDLVREGRVVVVRSREVTVADLVLVPILEGLMSRLIGITEVFGKKILLGGEVLHSTEFYYSIMPKMFHLTSRAIERIVERERIERRYIIPFSDSDVGRFNEVVPGMGIYRVE